eukprot:5903268-Lingulodinium_polyedra.AAC.1
MTEAGYRQVPAATESRATFSHRALPCSTPRAPLPSITLQWPQPRARKGCEPWQPARIPGIAAG